MDMKLKAPQKHCGSFTYFAQRGWVRIFIPINKVVIIFIKYITVYGWCRWSIIIIISIIQTTFDFRLRIYHVNGNEAIIIIIINNRSLNYEYIVVLIWNNFHVLNVHVQICHVSTTKHTIERQFMLYMLPQSTVNCTENLKYYLTFKSQSH